MKALVHDVRPLPRLMCVPSNVKKDLCENSLWKWSEICDTLTISSFSSLVFDIIFQFGIIYIINGMWLISMVEKSRIKR